MPGFSKLDWEVIEERITQSKSKDTNTLDRVERAPIVGGWLVRVYSYMTEAESAALSRTESVGVGVGTGITFVPDPAHDWKV